MSHRATLDDLIDALTANMTKRELLECIIVIELQRFWRRATKPFRKMKKFIIDFFLKV